MSGRGPQKTCPACDAKVHARKAKCPCGHVFASKKRAASPPRPPLAPLPTSTTGRRRSAGSPASYAEPSLKSKMRQKRGEAVVAAPKASGSSAFTPTPLIIAANVGYSATLLTRTQRPSGWPTTLKRT